MKKKGKFATQETENTIVYILKYNSYSQKDLHPKQFSMTLAQNTNTNILHQQN